MRLHYYLIFSLLIFIASCKNRNVRLNSSETKEQTENQTGSVKKAPIVPKERKIGKAVFYLENSGSMFGYVSGFTQYVDVVSELAEKSEFADQKTPREFYFINGGDKLKITPIGNNPAVLEKKLNAKGFNFGDVTKSNLNSMFQIALSKAKKDTISILISDGIYDIGKPQAPMNALATEGRETRSRFIERLGDGDLQTIMVKLYSHFDGYYFPVTGGRIQIKQTRPYYIWIFGETELLNEYFPEDYIKTLQGYSDMARFIKFNEFNIPYQVTAQNIIGTFIFDKKDKNKLDNVRQDRNGQGFQFSFATDFSSLPYSDSYFQTTDNYSCSNDNYKVTSVTKIKKKIYEVTSFTPTHLITVFTDRSPFCKLQVSLNNVIPKWINETNTNSETDIREDTSHTFGFKFLTKAISEAYLHKNKSKNIANFTFEIKRNGSSSNSMLITFFILGILIIGIAILIKYKS